jgi:hypothetical protein
MDIMHGQQVLCELVPRRKQHAVLCNMMHAGHGHGWNEMRGGKQQPNSWTSSMRHRATCLCGSLWGAAHCRCTMLSAVSAPGMASGAQGCVGGEAPVPVLPTCTRVICPCAANA